MMKLSAVTFLMLVMFSRISAQSQKDPQQAQQQTQGSAEVPKPPELFIDSMKKTVVFFQTQFLQNGQRKSWDGTGFLIIEPDSRLKDRGVVWLVTNKHMIRPPILACDAGANAERNCEMAAVGPYFNSVGLRINTKVPMASGNQFTEGALPVMDPAGNLYWCIDPDDEAVDLALFQVSPNEAELDAEWLPTDTFATKDTFKKLKINENDEVLFAGLFHAYRGSKRNFPIVRHGKLALVTDERIPVDPRNQSSTIDLILAEITSFGGNSGSPVFLRVGGVREGTGVSIGGYSYYLLGVMQGFFSEGADITLDITPLRGTVSQNSGIAGIIPADKILHILDTARARAIHERVVAKTLSDEGRFTEAEESYKKALQLSEKTVGSNHPDVAADLEAYALFLHKVGRNAQAKELEARATAIREKANTPISTQPGR